MGVGGRDERHRGKQVRAALPGARWACACVDAGAAKFFFHREVLEALWCVAWLFVLSIPVFLGGAYLGWREAGGGSSGETAARLPLGCGRGSRRHLGPVRGCLARGRGQGWALAVSPQAGYREGPSTEDRRRGDPDLPLSNCLLWPEGEDSGEIGVRGSICDSAGLPGLVSRRVFFTLLTFETREVSKKKKRKVRNVVQVSLL